VGRHLVEVPGGLDSLWLRKSLIYIHGILFVCTELLPSLPQLPCIESRGREGVICVAGACSIRYIWQLVGF
jgi:hypothetical protein